MKKIKVLLCLPLLAGALLVSSFTPKQQQHSSFIRNYAWYTPSGQFVAWSTLINAEFVSGDTTDPTNGTLDIEGYTDGGPNEAPVGDPVYKLYTHP